MTKQQPVPLENCIRVWESSLFHDKFLMSLSTQVIVESTVGYLKELENYKAQLLPKDASSESSE